MASVPELPEKQQGRPLLLGKDLESKVRQFILELRDCGTPVSIAVVAAAAKGIAEAKDAMLLAENDGAIDLTKDWGKRLLGRIRFVKCKCTTAAKKASQEEFEEVKTQYLEDIETVAKLEDIPPELVVNWDQTAIKYVPISSWTQEKKGAKCVEIVSTDDTRL